MATPDEMLRAIHAANPKSVSQRYNPAQLTAAFNALKKPANKPPPASTPPPNGQPVQQTPQTVQDNTLNQVNNSVSDVGQGTLSGTNPNESGSTQSTIDAAFNSLTQTTDKDQQREIDAKKQELANQGIPYSNDPNSRYQQEMGDIMHRYDTIRSTARNQAVLTGNQEYNSLYQNQLGGQAQNDTDISTLSTLQNTLVQQGFDAQKIKAIFDQLKINRKDANTRAAAVAKSGSGAPSGGDTPQLPVDDPFSAGS